MRISTICLFILLLSGCQRAPVSTRLYTIRSLVWCSPDSALSLLESLPGIPTDDDDKALYGLLQAQLYYRTSRPLMNATLIEETVQHYESLSPLHPLLSEALLYQGLKQMESGEREAGTHLMNRAARLVQATADPRPVSLLYTNLFLSARMSGNFDTAMRYYYLAQHYAARSSKDEWLWKNAVSILNVPYYLTDSLAARTLIDTILNYLPRVSSAIQRGTALNNVGWYYELSGKPTAAEKYYRQAIEQGDTLSPKPWLNLSALLERTGRGNEADSLLEASVKTHDHAFNTEMHRQLAIRFIRQGKPTPALSHLNRYGTGLRDYYLQLQKDNRTAIQQRYDLLETEHRHLKQYRKMQHRLTVIILSLILTGLIYKHYTHHRLRQLKKRMNHLYRKLKDSLSSSESARESLMRDVAKMTKELATKDAQLKRWQVLFNSTSANHVLEVADIRALTFYIKTKYLHQPFLADDGPALSRWLDLTDNDFACRLMREHPTLGKTEQHTVFLIRLGMDVEELSSVFDRSAQTIRQRIYRICMKMDLPTDVRHFITAVRKY